MEYTLVGLKLQFGKETPILKELNEANYPQIRQFNVQRTKAPDHPRSGLTGGKWITCPPPHAQGFSGTDYFFARELHRKLGVPFALLCIP